ncbi:hypothetical protein BDV25DRAFT_163210 [Aspergillus avenaceus]|uniref:Leucine-rich repeat-containing protein 40 n=1 Tax=Aspergillus avenaceus TaxID=36643 RepID=A0A5N6TIC8_ASPAV|nr:hypothetical protein BDV25DRAFT_163210 [Aspergillus avenaceus]
MDNQRRILARPSGIPRLSSKLPLPTSTSKSIKPSPSREKLRTDTGVDTARLRRPSEEPVFKKPLPKDIFSTKPQDDPRPIRDIYKKGTSDNGRSETDSGRCKNETENLKDDADTRGRARPSLSERTIETLSQIPPSPGSSRQSSFYNRASPMRSPSRPSSALTSYSRSPSRSSSTRQQTGTDLLPRPLSAMRLPSRSRQTLHTSVEQYSISGVESPSKLKIPSPSRSAYGDTTCTPPNRSAASCNAVATTLAVPDMDRSQEPLTVRKTRKTPTKPPIMPKPSVATLRPSSTKSTSPELAVGKQSELETRKVSKSSSALRESIAKAKAARKAAMQTSSPSHTSSHSTWDERNVEDPFNQQPKDSDRGLIQKRIEAGRVSGHLNIAALSLAKLPDEVMTMYDFDVDSSTEWYESVDLVKLIAADNEFVELPDAAFPDIDPQDSDADERGNQFGGLELLDLHGNLLRSLPVGFRRLQRLHTLNLSNNDLNMENIRVILELDTVRDLKLAKNKLQGSFPLSIGNLSNLEVLDLHENFLTELPNELACLTSLRVLNVGNNQLKSLPFEALSKLPLKELRAPNNRLNDTLLPTTVHELTTLQILDVASNALTNLSDHIDLRLPSLHTLAISMNRFQRLPNVSSWQDLQVLSAEDNSMTELPGGFTELKRIRNVDLTGNNLSKLDERIGLMENLVTFRIANNPIRERKFLNMNTDDLKRDLRNRCEPELQDTDDEGSVATQFTLAPETPAQTGVWQIKSGGILDRSYSDMQEFNENQLEHINSHEVRCLYLQHNELRCFPTPALEILAANLTDLDLSHNPLDSASLLSSSLCLPSLQILNISATGLTTLDTILANLKAPSLSFLDVSNNRISGALPPVRQFYPSLMTFLAADNRLDSLDFDAVQGLQFLDVGNNGIGFLPPKLGLLRGEGSAKNWGNGSALRKLEVAGNSFRIPRWQIVAKGTDAILEWLKDRIPAEDLCEWEPSDEMSL